MELADFKKPSFEFNGMYRGLVEDNNDPLDAGRIRIRVFGIHDFNGTITPVEELPWAYPALNMFWSGGQNILNKDHGSTPDKPSDRYDPGELAKFATPKQQAVDKNKNSNSQKNSLKNERIKQDDDYEEVSEDFLSNACGTGGQFVVPKRGNWVFLFFEGGNHMNPIYFAMAPMRKDWDKQKDQRKVEVEDKNKQIGQFKKEFKPRSVSTPFLKNPLTWAPKAFVNSLVDIPKLLIEPTDEKNRDVYSITSDKGTSIIIDNRSDNEKFYIIHKNYIDAIDEFGNKKLYVGKSRGVNSDPNISCDYEVGVEGNHEIFVVGDFKLYPKGNIFIQTDSNIQIDSKHNVGVVVREGNVDVIVEKGNLNADIKGNADINVGETANVKIDKNCNLMVLGDAKASVVGNVDVTVGKNLTATIAGDLNVSVAGNAKILSVGDLDITAPNVKINGSLNVVGELKVTGDISTTSSVKVGQFLYSLLGIDCGGFLKNRGPVDIGAPCVIHGLTVLPGNGSGNGLPPKPATPATVPKPATPAKHEGSLTDISLNDILRVKATPNESPLS